MGRVTEPSDVAEIQGLYGVFSFPEKLLQKVWLRGEFDGGAAVTVEGRRVAVLHPGKWNLLGGPDFRGARVRFDDGAEREGDVELHLHAEDWDAHGHADDPAYRDVVLHVVLFWPPAGCVTRGAGGAAIPILPLLPILQHDLEAYAADEAVETLNGRPASWFLADLAPLDATQLHALLAPQAERRWAQKLRYAAMRLEQLGWEQACHHSALEVMGYRFNRASMIRLAARWPLPAWAAGEVTVAVGLAAESGHWRIQGVRPANHPRTRLEQYAAWCRACPRWPDVLLGSADGVAPGSGATPEVRRSAGLKGVRDTLGREVCGDAVRGSRLDTLVCDAFLPLLAARTGNPQLYILWFHWFCGDLPPSIAAGLRHLGLAAGPARPACHGHAQGLLGWLIEREVRR